MANHQKDGSQDSDALLLLRHYEPFALALAHQRVDEEVSHPRRRAECRVGLPRGTLCAYTT
jgi:hypothetical protein